MARQKKQPRQRVRASLFTKVLILVLLVGIGWQLVRLRDQVEAAEAEKARLETQIQAQQQENDALAADIAEGNTQEKMEEIARETLGLVYPGERVFIDKSNGPVRSDEEVSPRLCQHRPFLL